MPTSYYISFLAESLVWIPFIYGIINRDCLRIPVMKWLFIYVAVCVLRYLLVLPNDIILITENSNNYNTLFFYNWNNVICTFIALQIYVLLFQTRMMKMLCYVMMMVFGIFTLFEFQDDSLTYIFTAHFNTYTYTLSNVLITLLSLLYFNYLLQDLATEDITRYSYFWINTGFLIYHAGNMFVFAFLSFASKQDAENAWVINALLSVVLYISFAIAFNYGYLLKKGNAKSS